MAALIIDSIYTLGLSEFHTHTDWEVYIDDTLSEDKLLYRCLKDDEFLIEKHVLLKYPDGRLYEPSGPSFVRVRVWFGDESSNWYTIIDKDCPISYGLTDNDLLHKFYSTKKGELSTYESSPYITDIKKLEVPE